ncbi:MAG: LPS assembly lipoprotein LptE [Puniceicoccales bacterium]|nr:LPS assembly lipoprotein LptE [Puniceicoccales bacterium]
MKFRLGAEIRLMAVSALFALLFTCGCAYHRVGWNHAPRRIVYVAPFANCPSHAGISSIFLQQLVQEINNRPGLTAGTLEDAEFILDVNIDDFSKAIGTTSTKNSDIVQSYALTLSASCTLVERNTGKEIFSKQTAQATVTLPTHPSFIEAQRQSAGQIASILAKKVCNLLSSAMDFPEEITDTEAK